MDAQTLYNAATGGNGQVAPQQPPGIIGNMINTVQPPILSDGRPDMTNKYNTPLNPQDEAQFQQWAQKTGRVNDLADYDMRGAWAAGAGQSANGHFTDQFKKPNHPTFSTESQYHGIDGNQGGTWGGTDEKPTFTPSKTNLSNLPGNGLKNYFQKVEPDVTLNMPQ